MLAPAVLFSHAQRFVEVHGIVASHFRPRRHLLSAADYLRVPARRFRVRNEVTRHGTHVKWELPPGSHFI